MAYPSRSISRCVVLLVCVCPRAPDGDWADDRIGRDQRACQLLCRHQCRPDQIVRCMSLSGMCAALAGLKVAGEVKSADPHKSGRMGGTRCYPGRRHRGHAADRWPLQPGHQRFRRVDYPEPDHRPVCQQVTSHREPGRQGDCGFGGPAASVGRVQRVYYAAPQEKEHEITIFPSINDVCRIRSALCLLLLPLFELWHDARGV